MANGSKSRVELRRIDDRVREISKRGEMRVPGRIYANEAHQAHLVLSDDAIASNRHRKPPDL